MFKIATNGCNHVQGQNYLYSVHSKWPKNAGNPDCTIGSVVHQLGHCSFVGRLSLPCARSMIDR